MVFNGSNSDKLSKIALQGAKTDTGAKGLNRQFAAETDLLNLQRTHRQRFLKKDAN